MLQHRFDGDFIVIGIPLEQEGTEDISEWIHEYNALAESANVDAKAALISSDSAMLEVRVPLGDGAKGGLDKAVEILVTADAQAERRRSQRQVTVSEIDGWWQQRRHSLPYASS
ncbi:MAG TPA: hypothetical protein VGS21_04230 [Acidimicrobiales bacterium]|nr:hypothetical protein [Acidimicrobiales bacterium]